jgi:hypothetical protein
MAKGYPDWRPPSAPGAFDLVSVQLAAVGDVTTSPGAGFRQVLYGLIINAVTTAAGTAVIDEVTSANVFVRRLIRADLAAASTILPQYLGVPLGNNNHIRLTALPGTTFNLVAIIRTEAV